MLKVKNKKVVREIAGITYRANKRRNLLTVFAIVLTTFLIAVVAVIGVSYWNTVSQRQLRMEGMDYDIELSEPTKEQVEKIRSMDGIKYAGLAIKCAVMEEYGERRLDTVRLYWLDGICLENQAIPAFASYQGIYPQKEYEIMLGENVLEAMGIQNPEIGMRLTLRYMPLAEDGDGKIWEEEFVLCGWFLDYSRSKRGYVSKEFLDKTGVKQTDLTMGALKIKLENPLYSEGDIIKLQQEIQIGSMQYISADYGTISSFCRMAVGLAVLLLMIFASGYLFIYNTLYISIAKDIRYYGQLKTVGMTSVQLRGIVLLQVFWNAVVGIPVGLFAAAFASRIMVPRLLVAANPLLSGDEVVAAHPWVYLAAGGFALLTAWVGGRKPAKIAGDCSAIEAVRYTAVSGGKRSHKGQGGGTGAMAMQNMFRDKKQAAVIFASFVISISVFLIMNVVILENDGKHILSEIGTYDMQFRNETMLEEDKADVITQEKITALLEIEGIKAVGKVTSTRMVVPYQEEVYGDYYRELYQSRYSPSGNYEEDMDVYRKNPDNYLFDARFIGIDERGFEILCGQLGEKLNWEDFKNGRIAVAALGFNGKVQGIAGKTVSFSLPSGKEKDKEHCIKIAAVGNIACNPAHFSGGCSPDLIVSEQYAKELLGETVTELVNIEYEEAFSEETERKVREVFDGEGRVSCDSKLDTYHSMRDSEIQVKVLGNSLGFLVAMLAVLNYLNMMAAGIQNRSKEFAILESIGMTTKQIRRMLRAEGAGYAGISIVISLMVGLPASYAVFCGMNRYQLPFAVPWGSHLLLFLVVAALCMAAPVFLYQRTQGRSITERLFAGEKP